MTQELYRRTLRVMNLIPFTSSSTIISKVSLIFVHNIGGPTGLDMKGSVEIQIHA